MTLELLDLANSPLAVFGARLTVRVEDERVREMVLVAAETDSVSPMLNSMKPRAKENIRINLVKVLAVNLVIY